MYIQYQYPPNIIYPPHTQIPTSPITISLTPHQINKPTIQSKPQTKLIPAAIKYSNSQLVTI
jgi:hypothetical protein